MITDDELFKRMSNARPPTPYRGSALTPEREALLSEITGASRQPAVAPTACVPKGRPTALARTTLITLSMVLLVLFGSIGVLSSLSSSTAVATTPEPLKIRTLDGKMSALLMSYSKSIAAHQRSAERPVKFQTWAMAFDPVDPPSFMQPEVAELTFNADGSSVYRVTAAAPVDGAGRPIAAADALPAGAVISEDRFAAGSFPNLFPEIPPAVNWKTYLASALDASTDLNAGEVFGAVRLLLSERSLSSAQQASLVQYVATLPDVRLHGEVTDRLGRTGAYISTDAMAPGEYQDVLIISADLGIIAHEVMYIGTDREDLASLTVTEYTGWY